MLAGCYNLQTKDNLTPWPPVEYSLRHNQPAVIAYDATNETYTVTKEMVDNAAINRLFIEELLLWKRDNGIR